MRCYRTQYGGDAGDKHRVQDDAGSSEFICQEATNQSGEQISPEVRPQQYTLVFLSPIVPFPILLKEELLMQFIGQIFNVTLRSYIWWRSRRCCCEVGMCGDIFQK